MKKKRYNLLITDPYTPQSYDIILGLRNYCRKVVAAVPDLGRASKLFNFTANSGLVQNRYSLKGACYIQSEEIVFSDDPGQKEKERSYVRQIVDICEKEQIDLIFPTSDEQVLLLAKYKGELSARNVFVPVNDYELLKKMMDKFSLSGLASEAGIPAPETFLADDEIFLCGQDRIFERGWIVKPRFGSASAEVDIIRRKKEFALWMTKKRFRQKRFVMQEYIPGDTLFYFRLYMHSSGKAVHTSCAKCRRPELRIHQGRGLMIEDVEPPAFSSQIVSLLAGLGYAGYGHMQLKLDERDNVARAIEFNARLSRGTWTEMRCGLDAPTLTIALLQGKDISPAPSPEKGPVFLWPVQDLLIFLFYAFLKLVRIFASRKRVLPQWKEMAGHYFRVYFKKGKKRLFDNYTCNVFKDPAVSFSYWLVFCFYLANEFKSDPIPKD